MNKRSKLNFRFHDPNDPVALASVLMHMCVDANKSKAEYAILTENACVATEMEIAFTESKPGEEEHFSTAEKNREPIPSTADVCAAKNDTIKILQRGA